MTPTVQSVEIELVPELLQIFSLPLQQGVEVEVQVGCSIRQLLREQFGISNEYQKERITTLFLNSRAVDDAATALVGDGAVLALSGAMPGLVGATMRSGGYYAAMRGAMTYQAKTADSSAQRGRIKIKLFNLLLSEIGPRILTHGILLDGRTFKDFLQAQPSDFSARGCRLNGRITTISALKDTDFITNDTQVRLKIYFGDTEDADYR